MSSLAVNTLDSAWDQSAKLCLLPPRIIMQNKDSASGMWLTGCLMMHQTKRNALLLLSCVSPSVPRAYFFSKGSRCDLNSRDKEVRAKGP